MVTGRNACPTRKARKWERYSFKAGRAKERALRWSWGEWELQTEDGGGHEAEDEDQQSECGGKAAALVEGNRIVDGDETEEADHQEQRAPHIPAGPEVK